MPLVAVVGSVNTDLVVFARHLPVPGQTVQGGDLHVGAGGKGANQAVAAARLGSTVRLVARVGDDAFGAGAIANLERHGVDTIEVRSTVGQSSGVALIVVDAQGQNLIAVAPGANSRLTAADVGDAWRTLEGASVMLLQLEVPLEATVEAARRARAAGMQVILNPAPSPSDPLPRDLLEAVDVIVPNEVEAAALAATHEELLSLGPASAVVTLGAAGAVVHSRTSVERIPALAVEAVDTTAAGDAFCGGLAHALASGYDLAHAARFGVRVAGLAVTRRGAQDSMPSADEVDAWR